MTPCKHLDHEEGKYLNCTLRTLTVCDMTVSYWYRENPPYEDAPRKVQFCGKGRGRINSILACYIPTEMCCHEGEFS